VTRESLFARGELDPFDGTSMFCGKTSSSPLNPFDVQIGTMAWMLLLLRADVRAFLKLAVGEWMC
jgi:hypothetical protein